MPMDLVLILNSKKDMKMKNYITAILKRAILAILYAMMGGMAVLIFVVVVFLENRPDLKIWHEDHLDAEYRVDSPVSDLKDYLQLEERLFEQLETQVLDRVPAMDKGPINRYHRGSLSDPGRWEKNWNRTFEPDYNRFFFRNRHFVSA